MTERDRDELRKRTHLEIACSAAVHAGLAPDPLAALRNMESILQEHGHALKAQWLRQRGGGIKGWIHFLRSYGFQEKLVIVREGRTRSEHAAKAALKAAPPLWNRARRRETRIPAAPAKPKLRDELPAILRKQFRTVANAERSLGIPPRRLHNALRTNRFSEQEISILERATGIALRGRYEFHDPVEGYETDERNAGIPSGDSVSFEESPGVRFQSLHRNRLGEKGRGIRGKKTS